MIIRFGDKNSGWVYNHEAAVAFVGENASNQFRNISLKIDELCSAFPFVCFDTPTKEDYSWVACKQEVERKFKSGVDERLILCQTDMLFVLSELESPDDIASVLQYVEQVTDDGLSFFVTHEKNRHRDELACIATEFNHVIYVEDDSVNIFYPVKQLLCDYYRPSFIGIDMADVLSVFPREHKMVSYFVRRSFPNMSSMEKYSLELRKEIANREKSEDTYPDFMMFTEVPQTAGLDKVEEFPLSVIEGYDESQIIWSCNFNSEKNDDTCTLMLQTIFPVPKG